MDGSVEEQLMVFLFIVAKNISNRDVQHQFGHSGSTISVYFHSTLQAMYSFARILLVQPSGSIIPPEIESDPKFSPFFNGCVGAIDGTHIPATIKGMSPIPFINRKGFKSQICLTTCSFDLQFQFMLPGWEGSAHDGHIISKALEKNKLQIPPGRYLLGDAGFGLSMEVLTPYRGVRYHLKEWDQGNKK